MTSIGNFRNRISIYTYVQIEEQGGAGVFDDRDLVTTVWGRIEALNGLVSFDTKQIGEEVTHKITIRYWPLICSQHWLKWNGGNFEIKNVKNIDERNQYLELLCRRVFDDSDEARASEAEAQDPVNS